VQTRGAFCEDGLGLSVLHSRGDRGKRAVGFRLTDGMDVPTELAAAGFTFARQRSKQAGHRPGSFFVITHED